METKTESQRPGTKETKDDFRPRVSEDLLVKGHNWATHTPVSSRDSRKTVEYGGRTTVTDWGRT